MFFTQAYTTVFGYKDKSEYKEASVHPYNRKVCQIADLTAPIVLIVLGVLALNGTLSFSACSAYVMISVGATLGVSQFLLLLNHTIIPSVSSHDRYLNSSYVGKEELTIPLPFVQS